MGFVFGDVDAAAKVWNGTAWENLRNNAPASTVLASAQRTGTATSPTQTNYNAAGVLLSLNVAATSGACELRVGVRAVILGSPFLFLPAPGQGHSVAGAWAVMLTAGGAAAAPIAASASVKYVQGVALPREWYCVVYHSTADPVTYSLEAAYLF